MLSGSVGEDRLGLALQLFHSLDRLLVRLTVLRRRPGSR